MGTPIDGNYSNHDDSRPTVSFAAPATTNPVKHPSILEAIDPSRKSNPFSDDVNLGPIEKLSAHLMLVDVFSGPQRFRFSRLGENIISELSNDLTGQFADEIKPAEPLNYFSAQASATIEAGTPTLYSAVRRKSRESGYSRILLPAWGKILSPKGCFPLI